MGRHHCVNVERDRGGQRVGMEEPLGVAPLMPLSHTIDQTSSGQLGRARTAPATRAPATGGAIGGSDPLASS
jgi:hypothetical protein